ncbi:MAG TPA: polyphosphate kinase 2 family protein [Mycobacteriales bacterium]|nr:polyphosphate kinase 2 family protein [Mycobacteriales bacterium]
MKLPKAVLKELVVAEGDDPRLAKRSTSRTEAEWPKAGKGRAAKEVLDEDLAAFKDELERAQLQLYASGTHALLLIFQAMDAAGKDGTIQHVMSGVNPQGCSVTSFKRPSDTELRHDFLWRCTQALPERGHIAIFNRSYYEDVLVVRVHPELLADSGIDKHDGLWRERYEDINAFERRLHRNGTRVVKFFLHVSKDEQRRRFLDRLDDPTKHWKFSSADLAERAHWDEYQTAYEKAIAATSTKHAPWYVIPADHKPTMRALVAGVIVDAIDRLGLDAPRPAASPEELAQAREQLLAEGS